MGRAREHFSNKTGAQLNNKQFGNDITSLSGKKMSKSSVRISNAIFEHGSAKHQQKMFTGKHGIANAILYTTGHPKTLEGRFRSTSTDAHRYNRPQFNEPPKKGKAKES